jgi:hypothetical protein
VSEPADPLSPKLAEPRYHADTAPQLGVALLALGVLPLY